MTLEETKAFLQREQEIADLRAVMSTAEGRRFIWKMLGDAGVFSPTFIAGAPDVSAFNEGARNVGLRLLGDITSEAPEQYLIMQKEAMTNDQKRSEGRSGNHDGAEAGGHPGSGDSHD